ncbi:MULTISPECIES: hypothetical protein [Pseudoalteromonas]|uniref:Uncharacterized protein n=1 Tax=Pseudoalteromonas maricaloris TaxID=184924 RepID=A0A8I2HAC1_9GAMM|nr:MULTISPECIES: hypothetical protein [Pseudoalteromonas]NLR24029.1 hypothetical protein [Pseudoalteromonas maricaloris]RZG11914.1 hypothetical protein EXT47_23155 [Pseudoalteromonas sp. CO342X]WOX30933.1 hypothetical protein R5H13_23965 [Pseudoalteromonas maricaloris]
MIEKVIAGVVLFILTSLVAYAFKVRQLYAVVPKLHRKSFLSDRGSVAELVVYNKGTKVEEDISLEIRQEIKCELLASNKSGVSIIDNVLKLDRIHSHSEVSVILLVEGETLSYDDLVLLASKEVKGSFCKKIDEVPPSASKSAVTISFALLVASLFFWGGDAYSYVESKYVKYKYENIYEAGWIELGNYLTSDLSESYSNQEFPLRILGVSVDPKKIKIDYELINKSSLPISASVTDSLFFKVKETDGMPYSSVEVEPLEKGSLSIEYPNSGQERIEITASFRFGDEFIHGSVQEILIKKYNKSMQPTANAAAN